MVPDPLTWAHPLSVEGDLHRVGLTSFAARELGEIVFVQLPPTGTWITAGELLAVVESTKTATDIYSPLSGTVTEPNTKLLTHPQLLSLAPESDGWLVEIKIVERSQNSLFPKPKTATFQISSPQPNVR